MPAPKEVIELVRRFEENFKSYTATTFNETQLRREFADPFFKALGWDIDNSNGLAEAYKDVIHEDAIKVGASTKAPDYCFRIGGTRKFFLETKKPSINLKEDVPSAFQLRRYGWSAKLPLSILTDFEELAVYDCRVKPNKNDKATTARIAYYNFKEYEEKWDEIAGIFSKDAVLKGSFDKFAEQGKGKRGTETVDNAFLEQIDSWRKDLAQNLAIRNPKLTQRELNYAVQVTLDRLIFLRICEDRGIEDYGKLLADSNGANVYKRLCETFRKADERYNSGLFHFQKERERTTEPDSLTLSLKIDDELLQDILKSFYFPDSPYEFSVLPADILGSVYERFLGKVIRLTDGHRAKIEEKPEVKKAGGVFYTPTYIVNYIVGNTVGKQLEGKTPKQVSAIRILDPACGSGSFLIGAYQKLLDWHLDWYVKDGVDKWSSGKAPTIYQSKGGWRLTTSERKNILTNNIYGVDIDAQAVEVTKLSLLLKVLEGETGGTLANQLRLFHERALPDLESNIKCGNSLIGSDYFTSQLIVDPEELQRVNPFDWVREFSDVMKAGGFDCIIGNPPYIRIQAMKEWASLEVEIYKEKYISASTGNYDIYVVMVEKGLALLNRSGRLGFILPHKFFSAQYGEPIRSIISDGRHLERVVHFGDQQVFQDAMTYTCLLFLTKKETKSFEISKVTDLQSWQNSKSESFVRLDSSSVSAKEWIFNIGRGAGVFDKLSIWPTKLADVADRIFQGLVTGSDPVFILKHVRKGVFYSDAMEKECSLEKELMHPLCKGSVNIRRYEIAELTKSILFPYKLVEGKATLLTPKEMADKFPKAWAYLKENRGTLEAREHGKWKHENWYAFGRSQNLSEMEQKKLLTPSIAKTASFTLDEKDFYYFVGSGGGGGGGYGVTFKPEHKMAYEYFLGLLNSKLLDSYLQSYSSPFSGGYFAYNRQYIEALPIRVIDFKKADEKLVHDDIVGFVKQILILNSSPTETNVSSAKNLKERQIRALNQKIDQLVYGLFDLSPKQILEIESSSEV